MKKKKKRKGSYRGGKVKDSGQFSEVNQGSSKESYLGGNGEKVREKAHSAPNGGSFGLGGTGEGNPIGPGRGP